MEKYLIDTNVVSDYFAAAMPPNSMQFLDSIIDAVPNLSVITQIELLSWNTDVITEQNIQEFVTDSEILNISPEVITHCVVLRKNKKIKTPDAIIAATAITYNLILVTRNTKDFQDIAGLTTVNPWNS